MKKKITLVSSGNGSITAAADLMLQGHDVLVYNLEENKDKMEFLEKDIVLVEGDKRTTLKIPYTTDPVEATRDAYMIMYPLPGYAIEYFAKELAPHTNEDTIVFFNAAASFGPLVYEKATGIRPKYSIETHTLTYATRVDKKSNEIHLHLRVKEIFAASPNCDLTEELVKKLQEFYPVIEPAQDLIHVFLLNANPETHTAGCLLNAGRIDYSQGEFYLYKEGITKSTLKVMRAVAKERREIAKAYGYELKGELESRLDNGYFEPTNKSFDNENDRLQYHFNYSPIFRDIKGPSSVGSRYFIEDIAIGLTNWEKLAKVRNIKTPTVTALIQLGEIIEQRDYRQMGEEMIPWELVTQCRIDF